MSQKSSLPQAAKSVSQVLMSDTPLTDTQCMVASCRHRFLSGHHIVHSGRKRCMPAGKWSPIAYRKSLYAIAPKKAG